MTTDQQLVADALRQRGPLVPVGLRATIEAEVERANRGRTRSGPHLRVALAGAMALALVGLVLALPLGPAGAPSVVEAHELGSRAITSPAPPRRPGRPQVLERQVEGVAFPDWRKAFAWNPRGQRTDDLGGREAATVFYEHQGHKVSYTIVAGELLKPPPQAEHLRVKGVDLYRFRHGGHDVVMFERQGRTCVISGHVEHRRTLLKLASWQGDGRVGF